MSKGLWANIHAKRKRIAAGSGEKMRKKGDKGAPTPEQMKKAGMKEEAAANSAAGGGVDMNPNGGARRVNKKPLRRFSDFVKRWDDAGKR